MTGTADLVGLRAIAEAATQRDWSWREDLEPIHMRTLAPGILVLDNDPGCGGPWGDEIDRANAAHIATFDPPTVISLIDRLSAAEANLLAVRGALEETEVWLTACLECETWQWDADQHDAATACRDRARSALTSPISREGEDISSVASRGGSRAAPVKSDNDGGH